MHSFIIITLSLNALLYSHAAYLGEQLNFYKPKLERNNILNKGLWMKDKLEKSNYGDFIFRTDSRDVDNLLQNNFDAFSQNPAIPVFLSYVERNKRSTLQKQKPNLRKSMKKCKDKKNCLNDDGDKQSIYKSKFISQLRPASVFNDYPYEVAILLANSNKRETNDQEKNNVDIDHIPEEDHLNEYTLNRQNNTKLADLKLSDETMPASHNETISTITTRRMTQPEFELRDREKLLLKETYNNTKYIEGNKINRNVFDKEESVWQSAPIQNVVLPRPEGSVKNKPITEKGLIKILSLLSKTFKKVMKQHNEIQQIDNKLHSLNEDFMKNIGILDLKFQEFDTKYKHLLEINKEMLSLNEKFNKNSDDIENKQREMTKNLKEFENQQKKFLTQQHQFYTIQKYMLDQNEKLNRKQSIIAKTQSDISLRQNNFARILKKAKQFYIEKKFLTGSKMVSMPNKQVNISTAKTEDSYNVTITTPVTPVSTDSVKINLFAIPNIGPLHNHDKSILNEKNDQPVDDLVYKYYFNNTFIDDLMKSKVLTAVIHEEAKNTRNVKSKRNDLTNETTVLLPVGKTNEFDVGQKLHRERRWIGQLNKSKKFHGKETVLNEKLRKGTKDVKVPIKADFKHKNDPFLIMATKFCVELGQNLHEQMLNWCIEKSLRKLKTIDMILPVKPIAAPPVENTSKKAVSIKSTFHSGSKTTKLYPHKSSIQASDPTYSSNLPVISTPGSLKSLNENLITTEKASGSFFPDNDELESNLKQYELKPDPEGTVYFDGSVHTSDIVISESDALSDIMPGLDSNSRVDVDPLAIDLQARRRAYVRRLNENIMKKIHY